MRVAFARCVLERQARWNASCPAKGSSQDRDPTQILAFLPHPDPHPTIARNSLLGRPPTGPVPVWRGPVGTRESLSQNHEAGPGAEVAAREASEIEPRRDLAAGAGEAVRPRPRSPSFPHRAFSGGARRDHRAFSGGARRDRRSGSAASRHGALQARAQKISTGALAGRPQGARAARSSPHKGPGPAVTTFESRELSSALSRDASGT